MDGNTPVSPGKTSWIHYWPLIFVPLVMALYYATMKSAFLVSMSHAIPGAEMEALNAFDTRSFGTHWFYRIFAEGVSITSGILAVTSMSRRLATKAVWMGAATISIGYFTTMCFVAYLFYSGHGGDYALDPWYQYLIDAGIVFGSLYIAHVVRETLPHSQEGILGTDINRYHLIWLWLPIYWYALLLIGPVIRLWLGTQTGGVFFYIMALLILGIPIASAVIPLAYGLALLAGEKKQNWTPFCRNAAGIAVIVAGVILASGVQWVWMKIFQMFSQ